MRKGSTFSPRASLDPAGAPTQLPPVDVQTHPAQQAFSSSVVRAIAQERQQERQPPSAYGRSVSFGVPLVHDHRAHVAPPSLPLRATPTSGASGAAGAPGVLSPVHQLLSPVQQVVSPVQLVSPVQQVVSPVQQLVSPLQQLVSPGQQVFSPAQLFPPGQTYMQQLSSDSVSSVAASVAHMKASAGDVVHQPINCTACLQALVEQSCYLLHSFASTHAHLKQLISDQPGNFHSFIVYYICIFIGFLFLLSLNFYLLRFPLKF